MAKLSELSELHLAALIAAATALGGVLSSAADAVWSDAATDKATNVQLVQLAIGILSEESQNRSQDRVLRGWAVETINSAADVKFDPKAQMLLVRGEASLPSAEASELFRHIMGEAAAPEDVHKGLPGKPVPQEE